MSAVTALAAFLITAIGGLAMANGADGKPPRATWTASFTLIGAVVGMIGLFSAVGFLLR